MTVEKSQTGWIDWLHIGLITNNFIILSMIKFKDIIIGFLARYLAWLFEIINKIQTFVMLYIVCVFVDCLIHWFIKMYISNVFSAVYVAFYENIRIGMVVHIMLYLYTKYIVKDE
jgi:hypothetical protein